MKFALISPNESSHAGLRIAQVSDAAFEVAEPLFWLGVADDVTADTHYFDSSLITPVLNPEPAAQQAAPNQPAFTGLDVL